MIYPTRAAVIATAAGAPVALAVAAIAPGRWFLALAWPLSIVLLCIVDALRAAGSATARVDFPGHAYVGETRDCTVTVAVGSRPRSAHVALQPSPLVGIDDDGRGVGRRHAIENLRQRGDRRARRIAGESLDRRAGRMAEQLTQGDALSPIAIGRNLP